EGELMFPGIVLGGVEVLAVSRLGEELGLARTELAVGDMLLVRGRWADVEALAENPDLLVVDDPEAVRRQSVPLGATAWRALGALAVTVALLASGFATPAIAGLVGAGLMVALRVVTPQHAYRAVSWQTVVLIGGLIPLSTAIASSGAADLVAKGLLSLVSGADVRVLLAAIFVLTLVLGQVVSNAATVLIVVPIAVAVASDAGIALAPVLMLVAVAGATSFLTPIATPANLIVMGPAGYRFADYWRLGLALSVAWFVVAIVLIPIVWVP
ncbi:SLC13 family permease, partial [Miniimonas arenae]|uniref:SLC13 family permease n=1 Tax=Miniimonas arenae TaxID=676201 RepID=UPI0028A6F82A